MKKIPRKLPQPVIPDTSSRVRYDATTHDRVAHNMALLGCSDTMIAKSIGIELKTLRNWCALRPSFAAALNEGRLDADGKVAAALLKRATGYEADYEDIRAVDGVLRITNTTRHIPPDTRAIEYWLNNRAGDMWKSKSGLEMSGPGGGPIETQTMSLEQALAIKAAAGRSQLDQKEAEDVDD